MQWRVPPWPSIIFLLLVLVIGVYAVVGYRNLKVLAGEYSWVTRSRDVLQEMDAVLSEVYQSEAAAQGFVMTGDESYVRPLEAGARRSAEHLTSLAALSGTDRAQQSRLARLQALVSDEYRAMRELVRIRRVQGFNAAQVRLEGMPGPRMLAEIRGVMDEMRADERRLFAERAAQSRSTFEIALRAGAVMAVVALVFLTASYYLLWRTFASQRQAAQALESRKTELEDAVRRRTAELQEFARELELSNHELEQFAFVASHDLQEPLRKIQTFADRLSLERSGGLGEAGRDYLDRMTAAATRMRKLVDDLLAYSRVHSGGRPFVAVDLGEIVREVLSDLEAQVERTGGRVEVRALPRVEGDPLQMRQLFQNLISNALKFHRRGVPPLVSIEADLGDPNGPRLPPPDDGTACRITIKDRGIGFDPVYSEKIFEVFQRLNGRSEYEGTGMGLSISRRIVERHGGRISAHAEPGVGATFVVVLPLDRGKAEA